MCKIQQSLRFAKLYVQTNQKQDLLFTLHDQVGHRKNNNYQNNSCCYAHADVN